jgi:DNA repair exonuclease SbcCD ATPase subunit
MLKIKNVTMRNFQSVGALTQTVLLDDYSLSLILGENLDLGGSAHRNGVGKTTMVHAISYALFGLPMGKIKVDNLINKKNKKGMSVSVDFEVDGRGYRVERGRKPNYLKYYVNDGLVNAPETDEGHGESKWTQNEIEKVVGMSHDMFKAIIALSADHQPFLQQREKEQRELIEELLSISKLSSKAAALKDEIKNVRDEIKAEEIRIKAVTDANAKVQKSISDLRFQESLWDRKHAQNLDKLRKAIEQMQSIDIEVEIENHRALSKWSSLNTEVTVLERDLVRVEKSFTSADVSLTRIQAQIASAEAKNCPTCGGELHDDKHEQILADYRTRESAYSAERTSAEAEMLTLANALEISMGDLAALGARPVVSYDSMEEALNHRHTLDKLTSDLAREEATENPYIDQIANLTASALQEVTYDYVNALQKLREHQEYLLKLLTSKDSFIRKKIIDQNLPYLNVRLNHYLTELNFDFEVVFQSDLGVEITRLGEDYDYESLSKGERNRLSLGLAWGFRDVWESQNQHVNLLFIDEMVDTGMDPAGMEYSLAVLKKTARERGKNIFLISHDDNLTSRVGRVMLVQKENGFTTYVTDYEANEQ